MSHCFRSQFLTSSNQNWLLLHLVATITLPQPASWKQWIWTWNPYFPSSFPYSFLSHSCCGDKKESIRSHAVQNHTVRSRQSLLAVNMADCYHWIIPFEKMQWQTNPVILWHCRWSFFFYSIPQHKLCEIDVLGLLGKPLKPHSKKSTKKILFAKLWSKVHKTLVQTQKVNLK